MSMKWMAIAYHGNFKKVKNSKKLSTCIVLYELSSKNHNDSIKIKIQN